MASYKDRRSTTEGGKATAHEPNATERDREARVALAGKGVDIRQDGSVRRIAPGYRAASDFFSPEGQRREVARGELLNVLGMIAYARRESTLLRRIWRWWKGLPQVVNIEARLCEAHEQTIEEAKKILLAQQEAAETRLAAMKGGHSQEGEAL